MAKGKIIINTDVATEVVNALSAVSSTLESDVISSLAAFQPLVEAGLISTGLEKTKNQATTIANSEKQIVKSISSHINDVVSSEEKLKKNYTSRTSGGGSYTASSVSSGSSQEVDEVKQSEGFSKVEQVMVSLSDENKIKLIKFIDFYKDQNSTLTDLLFNKEKSKDLYVLLKKAFSSSIDLGELSLEDMEKCQKLVLDMIMTSELDIKRLNSISLISCKEYFVNIASRYNISPSDLINDDNYRYLYTKALVDLYNGNVNNLVSNEKINDFRAKVDKLANEKNLSSYEFLTENKVVL